MGWRENLTNLSMRAYGMDPNMTGFDQDPSEMEFGEIYGAGLSQDEYAEASQYGLMEDLNEGWLGRSPALSFAASAIAPGFTAAASPIYDLGQAAYRAYQDPNLGILQAIKNENIPQMWKGRTSGATKFLADKLGLYNLSNRPKFREGMVESITSGNRMKKIKKVTPSSASVPGGGSGQSRTSSTPKSSVSHGPPTPSGGSHGRGGGGQAAGQRTSRPSGYDAVRKYGRERGGIVSLL